MSDQAALWGVVGGVVLVLFGIIVINGMVEAGRKAARREAIYAKYGHTEIAERIINKTVWVGESAAQLRDSLGAPVDTDERVLKTKRKETWKYAQRGKNRFGLRIVVENGLVVGWDEKL